MSSVFRAPNSSGFSAVSATSSLKGKPAAGVSSDSESSIAPISVPSARLTASSVSTGLATHSRGRDDLSVQISQQAHFAREEMVADLEAELLKAKGKLANAAVCKMATSGRKRGPQSSLSPEELASMVTTTISSSSDGVLDPQSGLIIRDELIKQIEHYGRYCFGFYACWMPSTLAPFKKLTQVLEFEIYDVKRFESSETEEIGLTLDLKACIPSVLYPLLANTGTGTVGASMAQRFRKAMGTVRSTSLQRISTCLVQIFDVSDLAVIAKKDRFKVKAIRDLIGLSSAEDSDKDFRFERCFPALYSRDINGDIEEDTLFGSEILFRLARCVIYGSTAVLNKTRATPKSVNQFIPKGIKPTTTIGLICLSVVFARFSISIDESFTDKGEGQNSGIKYRDDYFFFFRMLVRAKTSSPDWYMALMGRWNYEVFGAEQNKANADSHPLESNTDDQDLEDEIMAGLAKIQIARSKAAARESQTADISFEGSNDEDDLAAHTVTIDNESEAAVQSEHSDSESMYVDNEARSTVPDAITVYNGRAHVNSTEVFSPAEILATSTPNAQPIQAAATPTSVPQNPRTKANRTAITKPPKPAGSNSDEAGLPPRRSTRAQSKPVSGSGPATTRVSNGKGAGKKSDASKKI